MTQNQTFPVVIQDGNGTLRSQIFASRPGLVTNVEPLRYEADVNLDRRVQQQQRGIAVKVTVGEVHPNDFVVRSVVNGSRRKLEVLVGAILASQVARLPALADVIENKFIVPAHAVSDEGVVATAGLEPIETFAANASTNVVVLTDGHTVVELPGAVSIR